MNNDNMTFTVTAYGKTVTISQPEDIDIYEFLDTCRDLAIAMRYQEDSWKDAVIEMANEYLEEEEHQTNKHLDEVLAQNKRATDRYAEITHWGPLGKHIPETNC